MTRLKRHPGLARGIGYLPFCATVVGGGSYARVGFSFRVDSAEYRDRLTPLIHGSDGQCLVEVVISRSGRLRSIALDSIGSLNNELARCTPEASQRDAHSMEGRRVEVYAYERGRVTPVYRYVGASLLRAHNDGRWWRVSPDGTPMPGLQTPASCSDEWTLRLRDIEDAAAAFHRIADTADDDWMQNRLAPSSTTVDNLVVEARSIATIGQNLDSTVDRRTAAAQRTEALRRLHSTHTAITHAVEAVSATVLFRPDAITTDDSAIRDVDAMGAAYVELRRSLAVSDQRARRE